MSFELNIFWLVLIALVPAILVFLTKMKDYRVGMKRVIELEKEVRESDMKVLELEKELKVAQAKLDSKGAHVVDFNGKQLAVQSN